MQRWRPIPAGFLSFLLLPALLSFFSHSFHSKGEKVSRIISSRRSSLLPNSQLESKTKISAIKLPPIFPQLFRRSLYICADGGTRTDDTHLLSSISIQWRRRSKVQQIAGLLLLASAGFRDWLSNAGRHRPECSSSWSYRTSAAILLHRHGWLRAASSSINPAPSTRRPVTPISPSRT